MVSAHNDIVDSTCCCCCCCCVGSLWCFPSGWQQCPHRHLLKQTALRLTIGVFIHRRSRRGEGKGGTCPLPQKIGKKYFSGKNHVKFGHFVNFCSAIYHAKLGNFVNFSVSSHVKFGHFVNFSCIYLLAKCLPPKLTELLRLCISSATQIRSAFIFDSFPVAKKTTWMNYYSVVVFGVLHFYFLVFDSGY